MVCGGGDATHRQIMRMILNSDGSRHRARSQPRQFGSASAEQRQYLRPGIAGSNVRIEAGPPIYRAHGRFKCFMGLTLALAGKSPKIGTQSAARRSSVQREPA
jgi:hypothetical protein